MVGVFDSDGAATFFNALHFFFYEGNVSEDDDCVLGSLFLIIPSSVFCLSSGWSFFFFKGGVQRHFYLNMMVFRCVLVFFFTCLFVCLNLSFLILSQDSSSLDNFFLALNDSLWLKYFFYLRAPNDVARGSL